MATVVLHAVTFHVLTSLQDISRPSRRIAENKTFAEVDVSLDLRNGMERKVDNDGM